MNLPAIKSDSQIQAIFESYKTKVVENTTRITALNVWDDSSLQLAEQSSKTAADLLKEIEEQRKLLKAPFIEGGKIIDNLAEEVAGDLSTAINSIKGKMLAYQNKKIGDAKKKAEELISQESSKIKDIETKEAFLMRCLNKLHAILYGGSSVSADGKETIYAQPTTMDQFNEAEALIKKFPSVDKFTPFEEQIYKTWAIMNNFKENLKLYCMGQVDEESIIENKKEFAFVINNVGNECSAYIMSLNNSVEKTAAKVIQVAAKGTRSTPAFDVVDKSKVPLNYLAVDEKAIKTFIALHKERIFDEKDPMTIPGIRFYKKTSKVIS